MEVDGVHSEKKIVEVPIPDNHITEALEESDSELEAKKSVKEDDESWVEVVENLEMGEKMARLEPNHTGT